MKKFFTNFVDSAKEFTHLRSIVMMALLVAIHTVLSYFSIYITDSMRLSISFIANVVTGCLFGPVAGFICGGVGDIVQYILRPSGPYFFGWTLNAALAGMFYGIFFYKRFPKKIERKTDEEKAKSKASILPVIINVILAVGIGVVWAVVPFMSAINKDTGAVVFEGTAMKGALEIFGNVGNMNVTVVGIIIAVAVIILLISNIWRLRVVPAILSLLVACVAGYTAYDARKVLTTKLGFGIIMALFIVYGIYQLVLICIDNAIDVKFMAITAIGLTLDTIIVNIILGTEWCSIMYGKGFMIYFVSRLIKNLLQLPINICLSYYTLNALRGVRGLVRIDNRQTTEN